MRGAAYLFPSSFPQPLPNRKPEGSNADEKYGHGEQYSKDQRNYLQNHAQVSHTAPRMAQQVTKNRATSAKVISSAAT